MPDPKVRGTEEPHLLHKMRELMRTAAANGHFIEHADLTLDRNIPVKHRNSAGRAQPGGRGHGL